MFNSGKSTGDFHDCLRLDNNAKVLKCYCSFTQHFILVNILNLLPFTLSLFLPFGTCCSLCITFYFAVVSTFAFSSQPFTTLFLAFFSVLHCSTVFAVITFLVPFHLQIFSLTFISSHFEVLFHSFWSQYNRMLAKCYWQNAISQCQLVNFILSFVFTYLNHVILTIAIYCQLIANRAAASMASVKASKAHKFYKR